MLQVITGSDPSDPDEVKSEIKALLTDMGYIKPESSRLQHAEAAVRSVGELFNTLPVSRTTERRNLLQCVVGAYDQGALTESQ